MTIAACALYGVSRLIEQKQEEKRSLDSAMSTDDIIRDREELSEQIRALKELQKMASVYGFDISGPARKRAGGRAVALLRLFGSGQGTKRSCDVSGQDFDLPRHLFRARFGRRHANGRAGAGDHR